jgi:uncharacterized membrane protein
MIAGAIIIIVIAASGVLMMRFRKRWLAKINIVLTNRITGLFAGWLPGFGILTRNCFGQSALAVSLSKPVLASVDETDRHQRSGWTVLA